MKLEPILARAAARAPLRAAIVSDDSMTWRALYQRVLDEPVTPGVVGVRLRPEVDSIVQVLARLTANAPTVLLPVTGELESLAQSLKLDHVVDGTVSAVGPGGAGLQPGDVALVTSGTTGEPKVVRHAVNTLTGAVRGAEKLGDSVWLQTYPLGLYAGLQVLFHVIASSATLVASPAGGVDKVVARMTETGVTHISATPSWWRQLLLFGDRDALRAVPLQQCTLGGEVADQAILNAIREAWPNASVTHIYATSELGRCFAVRDGLAGFPAAWLETPTSDGVTLAVVDGQLVARGPNAMRGYADASEASPQTQLVQTGDLVEVHDGRAFFVGRLSERIHVGGQKVDPMRVEQALRRCPLVRDVRVYARRSSIAGELVAAEVVIAPGTDGKALQARLAAWASEHLSVAERPRSWRIVTEIATTAAGKRSRR